VADTSEGDEDGEDEDQAAILSSSITHFQCSQKLRLLLVRHREQQFGSYCMADTLWLHFTLLPAYIRRVAQILKASWKLADIGARLANVSTQDVAQKHAVQAYNREKLKGWEGGYSNSAKFTSMTCCCFQRVN
jgi:hypothetical protein